MIREKLYGIVAMAAPSHDLHWRMTPIALSKVRMAEDRIGDLVVIVPNVRPLCLGIPVEIVPASSYKASEISIGDGAMVPL